MEFGSGILRMTMCYSDYLFDENFSVRQTMPMLKCVAMSIYFVGNSANLLDIKFYSK